MTSHRAAPFIFTIMTIQVFISQSDKRAFLEWVDRNPVSVDERSTYRKGKALSINLILPNHRRTIEEIVADLMSVSFPVMISNEFATLKAIE